MKTHRDPRHILRIKTMQALFSFDFSEQFPEDAVSKKKVKQILKNRKKIDSLITKSAPAWPLEKINKIDLAILRQAVYELLKVKDVPPKVVVDEAVEIAKEYGSESSSSFVNGVLGKVISELKLKV